MSSFRTYCCDACGKELVERNWLQFVLMPASSGESETFDICGECEPMFRKALAIGLRRATDGNGRMLMVVAEGESE